MDELDLRIRNQVDASFVCARVPVEGDCADDEPDAEHLDRRRHLAEDDDADHRRGRGQQRDEQRVRRAREARHRELVADVRDHRRGDADADPRRERDRVGEAGSGGPAAERRHDDQRDEHRGAEPVDPARLRCRATRCPSTM